MKDDRLLGSAEVCDLLGIDRSTLVRRIAKGLIKPAQKLPGNSGAWLFTRAEVERVATTQLKAAS